MISVGAILTFCIIAYGLIVLIELIVQRYWSWFGAKLLILAGLVVLDLSINNATTGRVAFGENASKLGILLLMFAATLCGILARFVFYLQKDQFSWLSFFKPIVISPLVLLPLIGSIQTTTELNEMQIISFSLLAFQNGFFWNAVFDKLQPNTQLPKTSKRVAQNRY